MVDSKKLKLIYNGVVGSQIANKKVVAKINATRTIGKISEKKASSKLTLIPNEVVSNFLANTLNRRLLRKSEDVALQSDSRVKVLFNKASLEDMQKEVDVKYVPDPSNSQDTFYTSMHFYRTFNPIDLVAYYWAPGENYGPKEYGGITVDYTIYDEIKITRAKIFADALNYTDWLTNKFNKGVSEVIISADKREIDYAKAPFIDSSLYYESSKYSFNKVYVDTITRLDSKTYKLSKKFSDFLPRIFESFSNSFNSVDNGEDNGILRDTFGRLVKFKRTFTNSTILSDVKSLAAYKELIDTTKIMDTYVVKAGKSLADSRNLSEFFSSHKGKHNTDSFFVFSRITKKDLSKKSADLSSYADSGSVYLSSFFAEDYSDGTYEGTLLHF